MPPVVTRPRAMRSSRRTPRALGTGAMLLGCSGVLALTVPLVPAPAGVLLVAVIAVAGVVLLAGVPRVGAIALAGALGAAAPLLGAAATVGGHPVASTVAGGVALAVVTLASWRLRRRREWAPWYGTRGVVVASTAALAVLGAGVLRLADPGGGGSAGNEAVLTALSVVVPWSALVGAAGWLRRPVAVALLTPSLVQLAVVVAG